MKKAYSKKDASLFFSDKNNRGDLECIREGFDNEIVSDFLEAADFFDKKQPITFDTVTAGHELVFDYEYEIENAEKHYRKQKVYNGQRIYDMRSNDNGVCVFGVQIVKPTKFTLTLFTIVAQ